MIGYCRVRFPKALGRFKTKAWLLKTTIPSSNFEVSNLGLTDATDASRSSSRVQSCHRMVSKMVWVQAFLTVSPLPSPSTSHLVLRDSTSLERMFIRYVV